jgi:probable rRNA maturation factor
MNPTPASPAISVDVVVEDERWHQQLPDAESFVARIAESALRMAGICNPAELSILLADDEALQTLNRDFRQKDKPTNVLSFPGEEDVQSAFFIQQPANAPACYAGDIALSLNTIEKEAAEQGKRFIDHAAHMVVHGCLHLLGFDHESTDEAEKMEELEAHILALQGIPNPYIIFENHS